MHKKNSIKIYGLLYINPKEVLNDTVNLSPKDENEYIRILLNNAILLSKSLGFSKIPYTLLTNNKELLSHHVEGEELEILEIDFDSHIPSGLHFYSAHHKIDVFRFFETLRGEYSVLCDLDVVAVNFLPQCFLSNANEKIPLVYDISDQVFPTYSQEKIIEDIKFLTNLDNDGRWFGGEFIAGSSSFFHSLLIEIDKMLPKYFEGKDRFHHIGDEMIVTSAIHGLKNLKKNVFDAGTIGIINRYWSLKTSHFQKPIENNKNIFLLHLPSDKKFLSRLSSSPTRSPEEILSQYMDYRKSLKFLIRKKYQEIKKDFIKP